MGANLKTYRKKPVEVVGLRVDLSSTETMRDLYVWIEENCADGSWDFNDSNAQTPKNGVSINAETGMIVLSTPIGLYQLGSDYYVFKQGDFVLCAPEDMFEATYEEIV